MKSLSFLGAFFILSTFVNSAEVQIPEGMVTGLSSETFSERQAAQTSLLDWAKEGGETSVLAVHQLYRKSEDPEVRQRSYEVLRKLSDLDYLSDGSGYLGIYMMEDFAKLPDDERQRVGIRVTRVVEDSPASGVGLQNGDLITALDDKKWYEEGALDDFMKKIADAKPSQKVALTVSRGNQDEFVVEVRLGKKPVENLSGMRGSLKDAEKKAKEKHFKEWLKQFEKAN